MNQARQLAAKLRIALSLDAYGQQEFMILHGMNVWRELDRLVKWEEENNGIIWPCDEKP